VLKLFQALRRIAEQIAGADLWGLPWCEQDNNVVILLASPSMRAKIGVLHCQTHCGSKFGD
jgi:hypothetical protein